MGLLVTAGTRPHGSEGGRARRRAWKLVGLSITCWAIKGGKHDARLGSRSRGGESRGFAVRISNVFVFSPFFFFLDFSLVFFFFFLLELGFGLELKKLSQY